jgi:hypothetical protein
MLKKMMLLAVMALAATAFAVPASASADTWADNGVAIEEAEEVVQPYEGFLQFNTGATGVFGCQVTAVVVTNGPHAATITQFSPTTSTCEGTLAFKGCKLIKDVSNVPWDVSNATTPLVVTAPKKEEKPQNITISNEYEKGSCAGGQTTSHLEFASINIAVEGTNPIKKLTISGKSTVGVPAEGSLTPEGTATLGIL